MSCTVYAEPDALSGIGLHPQTDLNDDIEALGASGISLVLENARMTQQSTVTAIFHGYPNSDYYIWFPDTQEMTGQHGDQPPQLSQNQAAVYHDAPNGPYIIGSYVFSRGGGASIKENVAGAPSNGVLYYAQVRTGSNGQATITFTASSGTKPGLYTVRAERFTQGQYEVAHAPLEVLEKQSGVSLTTAKETVSAGEDITLTFTGQPSKYYILWVMNTGSMSGGPEDQPPLVLSDQVNVWRDPVLGPYDIGQYRCDTCRDLTLQQSVAQSPDSGTRYYARVMTDLLGSGTVTFSQANLIKPQAYTFRIEEPFAAVTSSAEV
ncbi:MAG: Ig-like domain-containing protein, partial [Euryarchaeota archaeon]|nr:Ig-like domain-containing protein [Euryarchaeota archaeon]